MVLTSTSILLLVLGCLALLPAIVNNQAVQIKMKQTLSASMKRQVTWSNLSMTWSDGLTLSGLKLGDGPAPLLKADVDQIVISPGYGRGADGRFGIDLVVRIQHVQIELAPGPPKPAPPPAKDPLTFLAESIQRIQDLDFPLPVDLRVMVDVAPVQVTYRTPIPGNQLQLQNVAFRFAMPSLAATPITAELNGQVSVDGRESGKVRFTAKVSDLVTKERRIHLSTALFAVDAFAPGTSITLSGGLSQTDGFVAQCKLNLPGLLAAAQPFIPPQTPKLTGNVALLLRAKSNSSNDLRATLMLDGMGLAASGGTLNKKTVGPFDVILQQQIATDHARQRVDFPGGSLSITGLADAAWNASVIRPSAADRVLELQLGPVRMDLAQVFPLASPFLPQNTPVKELTGDASIRSLSVVLHGPGNNGTASLAGFDMTIPRLRLALKKGELTADDLHLLLEQAECPLYARLPTRLTANLLWRVSRVGLSGDQPLVVQGVRGKFGLTVSDLNLKNTVPRKVSASAVIVQSFDIDTLSVGTMASIGKIHEQLRFLVRIKDNGDIEAALPEFSVTTAALQGTRSGKRFGPLPLSASLTASDLLLPANKEKFMTLKRAEAHISAGDFLQLAAEAALSGATPQRATARGSVRLDLSRALPFAAPFVPAGFTADGVATADWDLAALLPEKAPVIEKHPLRNARVVLSLFDKFECGMKLDAVSATVPSTKGALTVSSLRTKPDLRIVSTKKGEYIALEGGVLFSGVSGLPGTGGKLSEQNGSFVFNGGLTDWREFRLTEELRADTPAIFHESELNVSRIDALLDEKTPFNSATMVKRLDATLLASAGGTFGRDLKQLLPGVDVAGTISSGIRIDLTAGRELALRYSLTAKDFDAVFANGTKLEGLNSSIGINRVYALNTAPDANWIPLSTSLVRPTAVISGNPGAAEIAGRIHDDLRGDVHGARSFSIRRVTTKASGVPLVLTALEGDLLFTREKAGLSFFQTDLLGGTLLARSVINLKPEVPVLEAAGSFSNLDIAYLLPKGAQKRQTDQDTELTGEISLAAPLTPDQRELFEQLRLGLNVRKIGADTIERALFSLDPYERNEQLVRQRKTLRLGNLKVLHASAVDGAFSMEGVVQIKGVAVDLPKVERLRISELPLRQELVKNRAAIMSLRTVLDLVRADTLVVSPKGELSLKRRSYEK